MSRALRYSAVAIISLIVLFFVGGTLFLQFADLNKYKSEITSLAKEKVGYQLEIKGDLSAGIFPNPRLSLNDVSLSGHQSYPDINLKRAAVEVQLIPLLTGNVAVSSVELIEGTITLKAGENKPKTAEEKKQTEIPDIDEVLLKDVVVTLPNSKVVNIRELSLDRGWTNSFEVDLDLTYDGMDYRANGIANYSPGKLILLDDVTGHLNTVPFDLSLKVDMDRTPHMISGHVKVEQFDLKEFKKPAELEDENKEKQPFDMTSSKIHELMTLYDGELDLIIKDLVVGGEELLDFNTTIDLSGADVQLEPISVVLPGGEISGRMSVNAKSRSRTSYVIKLATKDLDYGKILDDIYNTEFISGKVDLKVDLKGGFSRLSAWASETDGEVAMIAGEGKLGSTILDKWFGDALGNLLPIKLRKSKDYSILNCAVARFPFQKGVAKTDDILFDTANVTIGGTGSVDLNKKRLDLLLKPKSKQKSLLSLATNLRISGPFSDISVYPDTLDVAKKAGTILLGGINPLAYAVPFIATGEGDKNRCVEALERADGTVPSNSEDEGAGGVVKGVIDKIGGGLPFDF